MVMKKGVSRSWAGNKLVEDKNTEIYSDLVFENDIENS